MSGEEDCVDDHRGDCHVSHHGLGNEEGRDPGGEGRGQGTDDDPRTNSPPREGTKKCAQLGAIARTNCEADQGLRGDRKGIEKEKGDLPGGHDNLVGSQAVHANCRRAPDRGEEGQTNCDRTCQEGASDTRGLADSRE